MLSINAQYFYDCEAVVSEIGNSVIRLWTDNPYKSVEGHMPLLVRNQVNGLSSSLRAWAQPGNFGFSYVGAPLPMDPAAEVFYPASSSFVPIAAARGPLNVRRDLFILPPPALEPLRRPANAGAVFARADAAAARSRLRGQSPAMGMAGVYVRERRANLMDFMPGSIEEVMPGVHDMQGDDWEYYSTSVVSHKME